MMVMMMRWLSGSAALDSARSQFQLANAALSRTLHLAATGGGRVPPPGCAPKPNSGVTHPASVPGEFTHTVGSRRLLDLALLSIILLHLPVDFVKTNIFN